MKHGKGIKGLDDKSSGMEILNTDAFAPLLGLPVRNTGPWKSGWCVVDGENGKMIFDFYSVNCLVR